MKFQPPKGTRDLMPEDARRLQKITDVCRAVFEKYGFSPLITPAFESFELLSAKGGLGEAVKDEIYYFKDKSDRELGLRFDLTMPLARVVSDTSLTKPFKRYAIDKVWRYDNPGSLRYREFWQADIDVVGSKSLIADIECLAAICEILDKLGFKDYKIRVNNRKVIQKLIERIGGFKRESQGDKIIEVLRTIDKMDKIGAEGVKLELGKKNLDEKIVDVLIKSGALSKIPVDEGKKELDGFFSLAKKFDISNRVEFDLMLVRGLEYYTGMVYEINLGAKVSCGGGGRYDNLIKAVGNQELPATGISLGLDRILEVMKENKMFKEEKTTTKVFITAIDESAKDGVIKLAKDLREGDLNVQIDLMERSFTKQLEFASSSGIPYVIIVGKRELKSKKFKLKDMKTGKQKELSLKKIISLLK